MKRILKRYAEQRKELKRVLAGMDETDAMIRRRLHEIGVNEDEMEAEESPHKRELFRSGISEKLMADAIYEVCDKLLGNNDRIKPVDLVAYLFIMVDVYGYGRHDFHRNGKRPFYEFFLEMVRPEWKDVRGMARRTMCNRINEDFSWLYIPEGERKCKPEGLRMMYQEIEREFDAVCGNFHSTRLGRILFADG